MKTVHKRPANHGLHLVLTLLTCGFWAITGWPLATLLGRREVTRVPGAAWGSPPPPPPPTWYRQ